MPVQSAGLSNSRSHAFLSFPSSRGQYVRRHDHIQDAIIDQIGDAIRPEDPYDIANNWCERTSSHRLIPRQLPQKERKL